KTRAQTQGNKRVTSHKSSRSGDPRSGREDATLLPNVTCKRIELLSMQFAPVHHAAASQCCTRSSDYSRPDVSSLASTRGKYKLNVEPWPSWLYTRMAPPLSSTKRCTWYSPSPLPSPAGFVVKKRW